MFVIIELFISLVSCLFSWLWFLLSKMKGKKLWLSSIQQHDLICTLQLTHFDLINFNNNHIWLVSSYWNRSRSQFETNLRKSIHHPEMTGKLAGRKMFESGPVWCFCFEVKHNINIYTSIIYCLNMWNFWNCFIW